MVGDWPNICRWPKGKEEVIAKSAGLDILAHSSARTGGGRDKKKWIRGIEKVPEFIS